MPLWFFSDPGKYKNKKNFDAGLFLVLRSENILIFAFMLIIKNLKITKAFENQKHMCAAGFFCSFVVLIELKS